MSETPRLMREIAVAIRATMMLVLESDSIALCLRYLVIYTWFGDVGCALGSFWALFRICRLLSRALGMIGTSIRARRVNRSVVQWKLNMIILRMIERTRR